RIVSVTGVTEAGLRDSERVSRATWTSNRRPSCTETKTRRKKQPRVVSFRLEHQHRPVVDVDHLNLQSFVDEAEHPSQNSAIKSGCETTSCRLARSAIPKQGRKTVISKKTGPASGVAGPVFVHGRKVESGA